MLTRSQAVSGLGRVVGSFWFLPVAAAVVAAVTGTVLVEIDPQRQGLLAEIVWPGDTDSARQALTVLATASVTVVSLSFSLVVIALQLASSQFSPRLLRAFVEDRSVHATLAVLVATFVYALMVLSGLEGTSARPPQVAMLGAMVMGITAVMTLVWFLKHILTMLRVDTMMTRAHHDTQRTMQHVHDRHDPEAPEPRLPSPPAGARLLRAQGSGFVRGLRLDSLVEWARAQDVVVRLDVTPGDHVVEGVPYGWVWANGRAGGSGGPDDDADRRVADAVEIGFERVADEDVAFGFRQLVDVGVKAMSPAINDPTTATHAISHLASLLCALTGRALGPVIRHDSLGAVRVAAAQRDFAYYVDLSCAQLRRFGAREVRVVVALLEMLRDVAACTRTDDQRAALGTEVHRVVRAAERETAEPDDLAVVQRAADQALASLRGEWAPTAEGRAEAGEDITA